MPDDADPLARDMEQATQGHPTIYIDGEPVRALGDEMAGIEILSLAGKSADEVDLYATGHHGQRIGPQDSVVVQDGSRFETRPRE